MTTFASRRQPMIIVDLPRLFERTPPHSVEAEMALLGSVLLLGKDGALMGEVRQHVLSSEDFYCEVHAAIYRAALEVMNEDGSFDLVTLIDLLRAKSQMLVEDGDLDPRGEFTGVTVSYLTKLAESVPSATNAPHYAKTVGMLAAARRGIEAGGRLIHQLYHLETTNPERMFAIVDEAQSKLYELAKRRDAMGLETVGASDLKDLVAAEVERQEAEDRPRGVLSGFHQLDEALNGFHPGEVTVIGARPSMGKTALACGLLDQIAGRGVPVALFSFEMSKAAIAQRLLSLESGIPMHRFRAQERLRDDEFKQLMYGKGRLEKKPIKVVCGPSTATFIRTETRRMVVEEGVSIIAIDYLQLMHDPTTAGAGRVLEIGAMSRALKLLALELNIAVVLLSQLNRDVTKRGDNFRPRMNDLRDSGAIEQDADNIILLHREDYYHKGDQAWLVEHSAQIDVAELIIEKQRNGPPGTVKLHWHGERMRFVNWDGAYHGRELERGEQRGGM